MVVNLGLLLCPAGGWELVYKTTELQTRRSQKEAHGDLTTNKCKHEICQPLRPRFAPTTIHRRCPRRSPPSARRLTRSTRPFKVVVAVYRGQGAPRFHPIPPTPSGFRNYGRSYLPVPWTLQLQSSNVGSASTAGTGHAAAAATAAAPTVARATAGLPPVHAQLLRFTSSVGSDATSAESVSAAGQ